MSIFNKYLKKLIHGQSNLGFTLVELLLIMGIFSILIGITSINLLKVQHKVDISASVDSLISDMKSQQIKAMNGVGSGGQSYGISFQSKKYFLFVGASFNGASTTNVEVDLDPISVSTTNLPTDGVGTSIVFSSVNGELVPLPSIKPTIILTNTGAESKTITVNKYGVATKVE